MQSTPNLRPISDAPPSTGALTPSKLDLHDPGVKELMRSLYRRPGRRAGHRLGEALRLEVARSLLVTGNALTALRFLRNHAGLRRQLAGAPFPRRPHGIRPVRMPRFTRAAQALEYVALSLLDHAASLARFEALRETQAANILTVDIEGLLAVESDFGYSNWLAGQLIGGLPPRSKEQVELINAIGEDDKGFGMSYLFALEKYLLIGESQPASSIRTYILRKSYNRHVTAFLLAALDPSPTLSEDEICSALGGAAMLSAIDRWTILLRCAQSLVAGTASPMAASHLVAFRELLLCVPSVEGANLLRELEFTSVRPPPTPTVSPVDGWLLHYAQGSSDQADLDGPGKMLVNALNGLQNETEAPGSLAVLDRQAVQSWGTRLGGMLSAIVAQVSAFSDRRSLPHARWLRLNTHPTLRAALNEGNIGRIVRLRAAPAASRQRLAAALDAARDGHDASVLNLLSERTDLGLEESAVLLDSLISSQRRDEAIQLAAELIVGSTGIARRLPFQELHALVPSQPADNLALAIRRAIVADAAVRYGASIELAKRNDCFDDVLELADCRLPSRAVPALLEASVPTKHIAYFLETICTPNIMDTVPVGRSTEELLQERIRVLNALCELRPERSPAVEPEIRQTAIVIAAKREMVSLDQRRVYVDIDGLRARLTALLAADFERYKRFTLLDPRKSEAAVIKKYFMETHGLDTAVFDFEDITRSLTTEADGALAKMLLLTRDEFATGPDFGLDGYLSGGIRHGNLEAHLREPFVKMELLGTFSGDERFQPPGLARRLSIFGRAEAVNEAFEEFARSFQKTLNEVLSEWVRIEFASENPRAVFQFQVSSTDRRMMDVRARGVERVEDFVDLSLAFWLTRLDDCLESARERVRGELSRTMHEALGTLDEKIREIFPDQALGALADNFVAPARGALDVAVDKLADWFRRVAVDQQGFVDASLPLEISTNLVRQMFPRLKFAWDPKIEVGGQKLDRRAVKPWVDIIHTLYVNAAQAAVNAGGSNASCAVSLTLRSADDGVHLIVSNRLGGPATWSVVDGAIKEAKDRLSREDALHSVRMEGRSGLVKVLKWARVDLRCPMARVHVERLEDDFIAHVSWPDSRAGLVEPE